MSAHGWQPSPRESSDLHVENDDRMHHDVSVTVRDAAGETVFATEFAVTRGDVAVHRNVFVTDGPYEVTVSLRYGPTERLVHDSGPLYVTLDDGSASDERAPADPGRDASREHNV